MSTTDKLARAMVDIDNEQMKARRKFGNYTSAHEGYAVILEEVDELWDEIKAQNKDNYKMRAEAVQVASTALRFIVDVCDV